MQLFGTGRILSRAGVIGALAVLPSSLFLSNGALVLFPGLWAASTAKGADTPLWTAVDPSLRGRTGAYFADRAEKDGGPRDPAAVTDLRRRCADLTSTVHH